MAAAPIESALHLGFRFEPTPAQAVTYYLPRLVAGEPMHAAIRPFVHAADVYACEPGVLAARFRPTPKTGDRFFFTACKLQSHKAGKSARAVRAAGPGSWHSQGNGTDVKDAAGVKVGEVKKLRYKEGGKFTDWLMDEFSSCCDVVGDRQHVLCKIYVSPRAGPDSAARQESDAFFVAPPEKPIAAAPNPNKRPAPPIAETPCTKRTQGDSPPMQAHHWSPRPSIQASTAAPAPCLPVAAQDPFCAESPAAAAQDGDDFDFDFAKSLEGVLEQAEGEVDAEADQDDTDWFQLSEELIHQQVHQQTDAFDAAIGRRGNPMMCTWTAAA
ncbi:hypothetical protein PR202_ga16545 [Eleusine coracana subsp. coracana]|uniref:NAC domain-containing protein n=1 Tax=Eleusine coracana subsp. coracana TaxID=191504 RepID=A0AAV5CMX5_ELECO|nr:hypothetical protein PR202_ga16545 [Eleusine coracana subsp. coracana]